MQDDEEHTDKVSSEDLWFNSMRKGETDPAHSGAALRESLPITLCGV
uniref:Uncharacterized protein n=1 Tax=Anguilla anguilla TaxID=7936 RepID=A0A0E9XX53_ANGAN